MHKITKPGDARVVPTNPNPLCPCRNLVPCRTSPLDWLFHIPGPGVYKSGRDCSTSGMRRRNCIVWRCRC
jgi:hypothetical protein